VKNIMTTEKIRVGIIGANVCYGWGRDAHIPALRVLPEFEITAVSTSRQKGAFVHDDHNDASVGHRIHA
jgi:predicted dehydrogenase